MNSVITNPHYPLPKNKKSHSKGWTDIWAELLNADVNNKCDNNITNYDNVYIDHGVNYSNLNLFYGLNDVVYNKFNNLMECKNVISLDIDMPDFGKLLKRRLNAKTTYKEVNESWCDKLTEFCKTCKTLKQSDLLNIKSKDTPVVVGDSHSLAFSRKGNIIFKRNGRTLNGALEKNLINYLDIVSPRKVTFCLGSIDIRHHLCRTNNPKQTLTYLLDEYLCQVKELELNCGFEIEIASPVPVEYEERKIPKSGYFNGTPFFGSLEQRQELTEFFINYIKERHNIVHPPLEWYKMDPENYAKEVMELKSSVHISPTHYRRNNWGIN